MEKLDRNIIVGVLGATSGLTGHRYGPRGAEKIASCDIPWLNDQHGLEWTPSWLKSILTMLNSWANKGDIVTLAMPGADLALISKKAPDTYHARLLHYRSMLESGRVARVLEQVPKWREWSGLAIVDEFLPPCQLLAYQEAGVNLPETEAIVPLCDLMTYWLTGIQGMDPVMRQSQGLSAFNAHWIYDQLFGEGIYAKTCQWHVFGEYELLERDDVYYVPVSHDSVFARRGGLWTGTWVGTDLRLDCKLSETDLSEAPEGLAIEGIGHTAAVISNVAFAGQAYKALFHRLGIPDYEGACLAALAVLDRALLLEIAKMPRDPKGQQGADWVLSQVPEELALASLVYSVAVACQQKLEATSQFIGKLCPTDINIAGGWAENRAFLEALRSVNIHPNVPPHANNATHAGLAAEAWLRYCRFHGATGVTFADALSAIPELK